MLIWHFSRGGGAGTFNPKYYKTSDLTYFLLWTQPGKGPEVEVSAATAAGENGSIWKRALVSLCSLSSIMMVLKRPFKDRLCFCLWSTKLNVFHDSPDHSWGLRAGSQKPPRGAVNQREILQAGLSPLPQDRCPVPPQLREREMEGRGRGPAR